MAGAAGGRRGPSQTREVIPSVAKLDPPETQRRPDCNLKREPVVAVATGSFRDPLIRAQASFRPFPPHLPPSPRSRWPKHSSHYCTPARGRASCLPESPSLLRPRSLPLALAIRLSAHRLKAIRRGARSASRTTNKTRALSDRARRKTRSAFRRPTRTRMTTTPRVNTNERKRERSSLLCRLQGERCVNPDPLRQAFELARDHAGSFVPPPPTPHPPARISSDD